MAAFGLSTYVAINRVMDSVSDSEEVFHDSGNIAVMSLIGIIKDSKDFLKEVAELEERKDIKGVVLRIDSPGGVVAPSQEMYTAIRNLSKSKKVVCSMGSLAASGGYYVASACDKIVASPGTLTGSIGVIMEFVNLKELFGWAKIDPYVMKAGKMKDIGSPTRAMTKDEQEYLQTLLNEIHDQFKKDIIASRNMDPKVLEEYADGRVFTGSQALKLGFVDVLGGEATAIELVAKLAGLTEKPKVVRKVKSSKFAAVFDMDEKSYLGEKLLKAFVPAAQFNLSPGIPYLLPAHFLEGR